MGDFIIESLNQALITAEGLYFRLVLFVGESRKGKTHALQKLSMQLDCPIINLNLELSKTILEYYGQNLLARLLKTTEFTEDTENGGRSTVVSQTSRKGIFYSASVLSVCSVVKTRAPVAPRNGNNIGFLRFIGQTGLPFRPMETYKSAELEESPSDNLKELREADLLRLEGTGRGARYIRTERRQTI